MEEGMESSICIFFYDRNPLVRIDLYRSKYTVNLVKENIGLETPENLAWTNFFGKGRISQVIPIIKEKCGYKPSKTIQ